MCYTIYVWAAVRTCTQLQCFSCLTETVRPEINPSIGPPCVHRRPFRPACHQCRLATNNVLNCGSTCCLSHTHPCDHAHMVHVCTLHATKLTTHRWAATLCCFAVRRKPQTFIPSPQHVYSPSATQTQMDPRTHTQKGRPPINRNTEQAHHSASIATLH